jgi:hypothetical protein
MSEIETIRINDVEYVRKDSIKSDVAATNGLKMCLVRSYGAGVFFGYVKTQTADLNGVNVEMLRVKRIHYWDGACSLTQVALEGTKSPQNCRITEAVELQFIADVIEIIPLTEKAYKNLDGVKPWKK